MNLPFAGFGFTLPAGTVVAAVALLVATLPAGADPAPVAAISAPTLADAVAATVRADGIPPDVATPLLNLLAELPASYDAPTPGDSFSVITGPAADGSHERTVLAAVLRHDGRSVTVYRFASAGERAGYFDERGEELPPLLTRRPLDGGTMCLGFGLVTHPILGTRKLHTGVTWAAPGGTAVVAAGNGTVEQIGRDDQRGIFVVLKHAHEYETVYGHLAQLPTLKNGDPVAQGAVIGTVGQTGVAARPGLYYEIRHDGKPIDPLVAALPFAAKLSGNDRAAFLRERTRLDLLLRGSPLHRIRAGAAERAASACS
jgi:murein DD-endopeptidase MepM/ murein hydrolase activator NlpD